MIKRKPSAQEFVHLHLHDDYSLLDGLSTVEEYAQKAKEFGWKYLAVTNHGMLGQIPRQYNICKKLDLKPIFGCEIYINDFREYKEYMTKKGEKEPLPEGFDSLDELRNNFKENYHLTLIAKNNIGYKNLIKITSEAWIEGFYRKPRSTHQFLADNSQGLICGSGCLAGAISRHILKGEFDRAYNAAKFYKSIFGENFYIELMLLAMDEQSIVNRELIKIAELLKIDLVITCDCHYVDKDDSYFQDLLLLLQNNKTVKDLKDTKQEVFQLSAKDLWYKSVDEIREAYEKFHSYIPKDVFEQALINPLKFAEKCDVKIDTGLKIGKFNKIPPEFKTPGDYVRHLAFEGLKKRGFAENQNYIDRIEHEIKVINKKNFNDYFLIVRDFVEFARKNDIEVGSGRGSAGGSLLCYCLGITDINPIKHGLFFERFLNEERKDLPDIDMDFAPDGRDRIKDYIVETYGREYTCAIGTYSSFQAKATMMDVCRVFDIPLSIAKTISKALDDVEEDLDLEELVKINEGLFGKLSSDEYAVTLVHGKEEKRITPLEAINKLKDRQKNVSAHAAGIIISNVKLQENLPLITRDGNILSAWIEGQKGSELSTFGFVKWDILGLLNLIFIRDALKLIEQRHGKKITLDDIDKDLDDPKVYEGLRKGCGDLIFQFDSYLMKKLLKDSDCDSFNTLVAMSALGRPGPLQSKMTEEYCLRKLGKKNYTIPPVLKEALGETYGCMVFQESVMAAANLIAGFTMAETDNFRKVLMKVKKDTKGELADKLAAYKIKFVEGGQEHLSVKELEELFDGFTKWASYGFNKSHAVAYTYISFRCAWLKTYYPVEYVCSVLSNITKTDAIKGGKKTNRYETYMYEAQRLKLSILPVDINLSKENFVVETDTSIRFGFSNIKGVGIEPSQEIVAHQPYSSFEDFISKTSGNKRVVINLIYMGAFDSFGKDRIELLLRFYRSKGIKAKKEFELIEKDKDYITTRVCKIIKDVTCDFQFEFNKLDYSLIDFSKYALSKEDKDEFFNVVAGFYLVHPLAGKLEKISVGIPYLPISEIQEKLKGFGIGFVTGITSKPTRNEKFCHQVTVEDGYGDTHKLKFMVWENDYEQYKDFLKVGKVICFDVIKTNPDYYSFNLNFLIEIDKFERIVKAIKKAQEETFTRVKKENLYVLKLSDLNISDGEQINVFGCVINVSSYSKKRNIRIYDGTAFLDAFEWESPIINPTNKPADKDKDKSKEPELKSAGVEIDDIVKLFVTRKDYKSKAGYQINACRIFKNSLSEQHLEQKKPEPTLPDKKCDETIANNSIKSLIRRKPRKE